MSGTCGLCDNFGVIDVPGKPGRVKRCPECDSEPPWYLTMSMSQYLFGPDGPTEDDDMTDLQNARLARQREEDANRAIRGIMQGLADFQQETPCPRAE